MLKLFLIILLSEAYRLFGKERKVKILDAPLSFH